MGGKAGYLLDEAASWLSEGLITEDQYEAIVARYEAEATGEGRGFLQSALVAAGAIVLVVAVVVFVAQFWEDLEFEARMAASLLISAALASAGLGLERRPRWRKVAHGLLAGAAFMASFGFRYAEEIVPADLAVQRLVLALFALLTVAAPALAAWHGHRRGSPGLAVAGYALTYLWLGFALHVAGVREARVYTATYDLALVATTLAFVAATRGGAVGGAGARWMGWALVLNAVGGGFALFFTLDAYDVYTDALWWTLLALYAALLFAWGAAEDRRGVTVAAVVATVVDAVWFGFDFGGVGGAAATLTVVALALMGVAQLVGEGDGWRAWLDRGGRA